LMPERAPGSEAVLVPERTPGPVAKQVQVRTGPAGGRERTPRVGVVQRVAAPPGRAWGAAEHFPLPGLEELPGPALGPNWEPRPCLGWPRP
jgi:hypothetical protein